MKARKCRARGERVFEGMGLSRIVQEDAGSREGRNLLIVLFCGWSDPSITRHGEQQQPGWGCQNFKFSIFTLCFFSMQKALLDLGTVSGIISVLCYAGFGMNRLYLVRVLSI